MTALLGREVTATSAAIVLGSLLAVGCAALPGAEAQYRVEEAVSYKQIDGQSLTGDLYLPMVAFQSFAPCDRACSGLAPSRATR